MALQIRNFATLQTGVQLISYTEMKKTHFKTIMHKAKNKKMTNDINIQITNLSIKQVNNRHFVKTEYGT